MSIKNCSKEVILQKKLEELMNFKFAKVTPFEAFHKMLSILTDTYDAGYAEAEKDIRRIKQLN